MYTQIRRHRTLVLSQLICARFLFHSGSTFRQNAKPHYSVDQFLSYMFCFCFICIFPLLINRLLRALRCITDGTTSGLRVWLSEIILKPPITLLLTVQSDVSNAVPSVFHFHVRKPKYCLMVFSSCNFGTLLRDFSHGCGLFWICLLLFSSKFK